MVNRCFDSACRCMPIEEWPAFDQRAWKAAIRTGELFEDDGPAAHWRPHTKKLAVKNYGRWLTFLANHHLLDADRQPAERVRPEAVAGYIDELRRSCKDTTTCFRIEGLIDALRVMGPDENWSWLRRIGRRLRAGASTRRDKQSRIRPAPELYNLGIKLMHEAQRECTVDPQRGSVKFRDGLIIALLAARPVRLRNIAGVRIGRNLVKIGTGYGLVFSASETKNRQPLEFPLPDRLTPYMGLYLKEVRPIFCRADSHDGLWASAKGRPMTQRAIYARVCLRTREAFGLPINPHLFRVCAATTIAIRDPEHVLVARDVLGHSNLLTTQRYYNQAHALEAARQYQEIVMALRQEHTHNTFRTRPHRR